MTALEYLYWAVVEPYQQFIIDDINNVFMDVGLPVGVKFKSNAVNYQKASDDILKMAYGLDEIRLKKGDPAMTAEVAEELARRTGFDNNQNEE